MDTLFTGHNLIELSDCPSVNSHAIELLKSVNLAEGTVIFTTNQTAGRGQRGARWYSDTGKNVTMSLILFPRFLDLKDSFQLSKIVSLGVYDFLSVNLPKAVNIKIKWPNDIVADGKKICGILIENILRDNRLNASIIGIGLNVNQEFFPEEIPNAISMKQLNFEDYDCITVIREMCRSIEKWYLMLRRGERSEIDFNYHNLLHLLDKEHEFTIKGNEQLHFGRIKGVDPAGRLMVCGSDDGQLQFFNVREIKF